MKGLIYTELVDFIEQNSSAAVTELIILDADLENQGAFTAVGKYHFSEAIKLVASASRHLKTPATDLMRLFGRQLFSRLLETHPHFLPDETEDAFGFLSKVQSHIHTEVSKLYDDSEPPHIETSMDSGKMTVSYKSHRPFAEIAFGLIEGCCAHFGDALTVEMHAEPDANGTRATFTLKKNSDI